MEEIRFASAHIDITPVFAGSLPEVAGKNGTVVKTGPSLLATAIRFSGEACHPIIISLDLSYAGSLIREKLMERFGGIIEPPDLFLCATNNHFAPVQDSSKPLPDKVDEGHFDFVLKKLYVLVEKVVNQVPAGGTIHYGEQFVCHRDGSRTRRNQTLPVPDIHGGMEEKTRVLTVKNQSGFPACVLWAYACHPVNDPMAGGMNPECPGAVRGNLQKIYGDKLEVIFLPGFSGDIRSCFHSHKRNAGIKERIPEILKSPSFSPLTNREMQTWNETLSASVCDAVNMSVNLPALDCVLRTKRKELPLGDLLEGASGNRTFPISRLDFGPQARLVGLPAGLGARFSSFLQEISFGRFIFPVGCADDVFGYLPTPEMIGTGGHGDQGLWKRFSPSGPFTPGFENKLKTSIAEILSEGSSLEQRRRYRAEDLEDGLRRLGLGPGDLVLVTSALRAIGEVNGSRAKVFLDALFNVIGPEGTVIGLAFNDCLSGLFKKKKAVVTRETVPTTGGMVIKLLGMKGALRSKHPSNSIVAVGPLAAKIVAGHDESVPCFSFIEKMLEHNGKMIIVGCVDVNPGISTVHLAQEKLGLSYLNIRSRQYSCLFEKDGKVETFWRKDAPGCSLGFNKFYPHYIRHGKLRVAFVGEAFSYAINLRDAYEIDYALLKKDPTFALCSNPSCRHCRGSLLYNIKDFPRFYLNTALRIAGNRLRRIKGKAGKTTIGI